MTRPTVRLLLVAAAALAAVPSGATAARVCVRVDVAVPDRVTGWGTCAATTSLPVRCTQTSFTALVAGVSTEVCAP